MLLTDGLDMHKDQDEKTWEDWKVFSSQPLQHTQKRVHGS